MRFSTAILVIALAGCGGPGGGHPGGSTKNGFIELDATGSAFAEFVDATNVVANVKCSNKMFGACTLTACATVMTDGGATQPHIASAGLITVDGELMPLRLEPQSNGMYQPNGGGGWSGGEHLDVKAAGAEVPAFAATLTAPHAGTVEAPPMMDSMTIDRTKDLALAWTAQGADAFRFTVTGNDLGNFAVCNFPAGASSGVVPSAVLSQILGDGVNLDGAFVAESKLGAGGWSVTVTATAGVYHSNFDTLM